MKTPTHQSAKPSHYNEESKHYDTFNEKNSRVINATINAILKRYHVHSVVDLTCGTGSQVFWLSKRGFDVVGCDINGNMLKIAKNKAEHVDQEMSFQKADMRTARVGKFDAAITIFNAIGHLTKADFKLALKNIRENLNVDGLYLFDIFNADFLRHKDNITTFTIDWCKVVDDIKARVIQYSTIDENGVMASFTTQYEQKKNDKPKKSVSTQTLQVYGAHELRDLLHKHGFRVVTQSAIDGSKFKKNATDRILTVAQKVEIINDRKGSTSTTKKGSLHKSNKTASK